MPTPNEHPLDVVIEGHTLRVGNRMYNIGNLAGTTVDRYAIGYAGGPRQAIWTKKWQFLAAMVALAIPEPLVQWLGVAGFVLTVAQVVRLVRQTATGYMLKLETAGRVSGVITSRDPEAINGLARELAKAINHPPATAQQYVIHGDLVQQTGSNNVATQVR